MGRAPGGLFSSPLLPVGLSFCLFFLLCFGGSKKYFFFRKKAREAKSHTFLPSSAQTLPASSLLSSRSVSSSLPVSRRAVHKVNVAIHVGHGKGLPSTHPSNQQALTHLVEETNPNESWPLCADSLQLASDSGSYNW